MKIFTEWIKDAAVTIAKMGLFTSSSTPEKAGPVGADRILLEDSASSWAKRWALLTNLPASTVTGWKQSVRVRANVNIDISSAPKSVDGVTLVNGDRVLLAEQSTSTQDGIYIFDAKGNPMTRAADAQVGDGFAGVAVFVEEGTSDNEDRPFVCTNDQGSDVIGTDDLTFTIFTTVAAAHELGSSTHSLSGWAAFKAKINIVNPLRDIYSRIQWMHKVTAGEVTAGYLTLPSTPADTEYVCVDVVTASASVRQINKEADQSAGGLGVTPDFQVLSSTQLHINNNGAAVGLSGDIVQDDVLIVTYTISEA